MSPQGRQYTRELEAGRNNLHAICFKPTMFGKSQPGHKDSCWGNNSNQLLDLLITVQLCIQFCSASRPISLRHVCWAVKRQPGSSFQKKLLHFALGFTSIPSISLQSHEVPATNWKETLWWTCHNRLFANHFCGLEIYCTWVCLRAEKYTIWLFNIAMENHHV